MKPNFALTLSFEGISLLHRAFPGWHMVGEVSLDSSDLAGALSDLRNRAGQLDSNPIRSKLVIPNDQIRFLQFDSEGLEADEIASAVHRALDGATPYAVDDLAYDWSISAGQVHIAAVARETLAEAEAFATEHGFNPLCFVAAPEGRDFVGEPWFGETKSAPSLLPEGGRIERDTAAIRVIGTAPLHGAAAPASGAAPEAALEGATDAADAARPPAPEPDLPPEVPPAPDPEIEPEIQPDPEPVPEVPPTPQPDIPPEPVPQPDPDIPPNPTPGPAVAETDVQDGDGVANASTDPDAKDERTDAAGNTPAAPVAFSSIRAQRDTLPTAPRRLSGATRDGASPAAEAPSRETPRAEPTLTAATPSVTGAGTGTGAAAKVTGKPQDALPADAAARIGATLRASDDTRLTPPDAEPSTAEGPPGRAHTDVEDDGSDIPPPPAFMADRTGPAPFDLPEDTPNAPLAAPAAEGQAAASSGALSFFSRRKTPKPDKRQPARTDARPSPEAQREQERQRMTVFGARKTASVGGKPRFLGLILTAVLLIFLVGVAAWASIFLEDGISRVLRGSPDPAEQIAATPDAEVPPGDTDGASASSSAQTDEGESVLAALPGVTSDGAETPRADPQPAPNPAELTEQQARTRYAVTGIWQRAPDAPTDPGTQNLDDFYLTSIDPKVVEQDAVALPAPESLRGDTRPDTPADPAAADTMFTMDTRGLVQPTPEGALTPDGVLVYAGQPALVPPDRPAETLAQPGEDPAEAAARIEALERIAALRPRVRPGDLSETNERETLGGRTRNELATLRPRLRPQSAQELAEEAAAASEAATEAAAATPDVISPDPDAVTAALQAAAAVPAPDPFAGATAQAVKVSAKPNARPRNFNRIVQRSQRLAEQQEARTAAVAVPRNQRISPSGPTPTTVARAATEKNALRMRQVNLIGVYGSNSNRRALVRLANGSYKKVKVGDRLDGGRVAAIGTSELRYVKSGRQVTLTMPRG
ncbi:Type IV pilus biogenesis [Roseovarius sp. THAF27]|uniref:hypothetical protein n=1 Tax=Roseovarius sp. THAF27 TaxID=2587850 RepID=UPI0012A7C25E|nr:hypothetical protein [Roseovarius sp. THAF27]QFT80244.1 Type IV pilus biogenesis [Roseovarius sp. THAF27]